MPLFTNPSCSDIVELLVGLANILLKVAPEIVSYYYGKGGFEHTWMAIECRQSNITKTNLARLRPSRGRPEKGKTWFIPWRLRLLLCLYASHK
jgi:hypothetical protein